MKYFLLCWSCKHPHDAARYKADEHNVKCDECSGQVVTNSGKVQIARVEDLSKLFKEIGYRNQKISQ
jgi:hypothetical protein